MTLLNTQFTGFVLDLSLGQLALNFWEMGQQALEKWQGRGMYAVLEYESTLELHDPQGQQATFRKRQQVRYLQDHIIAFEDMGWGDGKILLDYVCSPGIPVDRYRLDYKTLILISLREIKNRGDEDEFQIRWGIQDGFLRSAEQWATEIRYPQQWVKVAVIFPPKRPPQHWSLFEKNRQRTQVLGQETRQRLPDGRWRLTWEQNKPRLHETYILKWEW